MRVLLELVLWALILAPAAGAAYLTYGAMKGRRLEHTVLSLEVRALMNSIDHRFPFEAPLSVRFRLHEQTRESLAEMPMGRIIPPISPDDLLGPESLTVEDASPHKENYKFAPQFPQYSEVMF